MRAQPYTEGSATALDAWQEVFDGDTPGGFK